MPIKVKASGAWKDAAPKVKVSGSWKDASSFVKAGGLWYQASSNGLNIIIDSATTLYDFNLKTYIQDAGIWPASGPVVIDKLTVTARTVITQDVGQEVVAYEDRLANSTPWRATPRGYKMVTKSVVISGHTYYQFISYQENPDLYPAFTTGSGWPAGSLIKTLQVEGVIYGKGADGMGHTTTYAAQYQGPDGTIYKVPGNGSSTSEELLVGLRHGYPAVSLTIPVTTLTVTGGVYGGGAAASRALFTIYPLGTPNQQTCGVPVAAWPERLTGEFTLANPITRTGAGGVAYVTYYTFRGGILNPYLQIYSGTYSPDTLHMNFPGAHGHGGGQGFGKGGGAFTSLPVLSGGAFAPGYTGLPGGNGTLTAPGAAPSSVVDYYFNDSKYGAASTIKYPTDTFDGLPWGTERTAAYTYKGDLKAAGAGRALNPPTMDFTVPAVGMYPNLANTRVFGSKAGAAILGTSNVTTYTSLTQIKGNRL